MSYESSIVKYVDVLKKFLTERNISLPDDLDLLNFKSRVNFIFSLKQDEEFLKFIFINEPYYLARHKALQNIEDQNFLAKIIDDPDQIYSFKIIALSNIKDQKIIYELALNQKDEDILDSMIGSIYSITLLDSLKEHLIKHKRMGVKGQLYEVFNQQYALTSNSISFILD